MRHYLTIALALSTGWAALFCSKPADRYYQTLVRLNNTRILLGDFEAIMPQPTGDTAADRAAREKTLQQMIDQKLIALEGIRLGYADSLKGSIDKARSGALLRELDAYSRKLTPTREDIRQESLLTVTEMRLKLLEVGTYDTAMMVAALLRQGVPFESLAVRYNRSGLGAPDGDLGYQSINRNPPEVTQVLATMKPGDVSDLIVRAWIYYDFVKLADRRISPKADSLARDRKTIEEFARQRKSRMFILKLRNQVQYDEEAVNYLVNHVDSLLPSDSGRVVARLPNGYKTRIGYLAPLVKTYPNAYGSLRRRALKEDIEKDILDREARRLKLDRGPEFERSYNLRLEGGIYQYVYPRLINAGTEVTLADAEDYFQQHRDRYPGKEFLEIAEQVRNEMQSGLRQKHYDEVIKGLRAKARIEIDRKLLAGAKPAAKPQ